MSFASDVKDELCKNIITNNNARLSLLEALLRINCEIILKEKNKFISFKTANKNIANLFMLLVKTFYDCEIEISEEQNRNLRKNIYYTVFVKTQGIAIIEEFDLLRANSPNKDAILSDEECIKAYLLGAFLAKGSVNDPNKNHYHLEIVSLNDIETIFIQKLMNHYDLNAKIIKRRSDLVVYLKDVQMIKDFLIILGCVKTIFVIEDAIIKKEIAGNIKRTMVFEIANEQRGMIAAQEQLKYVNYLYKHFGLEKIDEKIKNVMNARMNNPNAPISELIAYIKENFNEDITKSGIHHRFRKIKQIAIEHERRKRV